jgi:tRNA-dihydrouridine synthase C
MEGVTRDSFCTLMTRRNLVSCWISPFVRISTGVPRRARLQEKVRLFLDSGLPVVAQIMGTDIGRLCGTAERLAELGVAGVDLNCGCPTPIVVRNGAGGARLRDPQWIHDALVGLRRACPACGVSVKLRAGFADPAEMSQILPAVRAAAPDFVVLHFRTVAEMYRKVDGGLERLARARELLPDVPLLGSGDLFTPEDALAMYRQTGVDGIAPARGLLKNPWLLRDIEALCRGEAPPAHDQAEAIGFLVDLATLALESGSRHHGFVMQQAAYLFGREQPIFATLVRCRNLPEVCQVLKDATQSEFIGPVCTF